MLRQKRFYSAGWTSGLSHQAHNLGVGGSNPSPATKLKKMYLCRGIWNTRAFEIVGETSVKDGYTLYGYDEVERSCK